MIYFWDNNDSADGGYITYGANVHDARNKLTDHFDQTAQELDIDRAPDKTYSLSEFQFLLRGELVDGW